MVICVNKNNPIASLTIADLASIFGNGGIRDWSELGVQLPKGGNKLAVGFATGYRNARSNFRSKVLAQGRLDSSVNVMSRADDAITMLLQEPNAVVCLDEPELARREKNVRIVPVRADESSPPIWPEAGSIDNGKYLLVSEFFVLTRKDGGPDVMRFVNWLKSKEGRASTDQAGYTPAR
jgi:ABC-type phosphate transport system substrate-binding protein